jgi:hypothetical protein
MTWTAFCAATRTIFYSDNRNIESHVLIRLRRLRIFLDYPTFVG